MNTIELGIIPGTRFILKENHMILFLQPLFIATISVLTDRSFIRS